MFFGSIKIPKENDFGITISLKVDVSTSKMVNVKTLLLFAAISIAAAVPMKSSRSKFVLKDSQKKFLSEQLKQESMLAQRDSTSIKENYEKLMTNSKTENVDQFNTRTFRLPNNTIPLHYDIHLRTNVHSGDFAFHGSVIINIRVLEASNTITLHSSQMLVQTVNLLDAQGNTIERNLPFILDNTLQFLVITTGQQMQRDQEFAVEVTYSGFLRTDRLGFYRTSYNDRELRQTFWVATTLFEPTHARHAFPCYDEIRFRTTFDIQIVHHESYHALSNMPIAEKTTNNQLVTTKFQTTLSMPTYNVAFTVSNFASVSNNIEDLPINVYAEPNAISAGQADDALELGEKMLRTMEDVFEIPYSLPKSDQVAVSHWRNGESWGLIKISNFILLNTGNDDEWLRRQRQLQIAHEYSVSFKF